jgi:hypothetical protein
MWSVWRVCAHVRVCVCDVCGRLAERGDVRLLFLVQQAIHLVWCHDSLHLDLPAIHAQDPFHISRVTKLAQKVCTLVGVLAVMPPYFLCSFALIQCIIISFTTLWHPTAAVLIRLSISMAFTFIGCNYNTRATISSKKKKICKVQMKHITQLYRQVLSEAGRHRLSYIICIFMQAQPWTFALS